MAVRTRHCCHCLRQGQAQFEFECRSWIQYCKSCSKLWKWSSPLTHHHPPSKSLFLSSRKPVFWLPAHVRYNCVFSFIVVLGWILGKPMSLLFDPYESVVLFFSGMFPLTTLSMTSRTTHLFVNSSYCQLCRPRWEVKLARGLYTNV